MTEAMDDQLPEAWRRAIEQSAEQNGSIKEVWLFGSRARSEAADDSDIDIAVTLMPHDWARGSYVRFDRDWRRALSELVGRHVSLELKEGLPPKADAEAVLLWKRA